MLRERQLLGGLVLKIGCKKWGQKGPSKKIKALFRILPDTAYCNEVRLLLLFYFDWPGLSSLNSSSTITLIRSFNFFKAA